MIVAGAKINTFPENQRMRFWYTYGVPGRRSLPENMIICCCGARLGVLLMPEADTAIWEQYDVLTIAEFLEEVSSYCYEELGHTWDATERNLAVYNGHLVALDFGDPEADCY